MYYDLVSLGIILVGATQIPDPGHGSYENFDSQRSNSSLYIPSHTQYYYPFVRRCCFME
jgi:hypothetical protein